MSADLRRSPGAGRHMTCCEPCTANDRPSRGDLTTDGDGVDDIHRLVVLARLSALPAAETIVATEA